MTEKEIHLKLSEVKIDNDNLDYIKMVGEICGKLRWDLVILFSDDQAIDQLQTRIKELERTIENMKEKTTLNEVKRFECGTDDLVVFKYLIENKVKVKRYDGEILTVINITELQNYPILLSNYEKYSKNGFFKNFTNIDGSEFYYD